MVPAELSERLTTGGSGPLRVEHCLLRLWSLAHALLAAIICYQSSAIRRSDWSVLERFSGIASSSG
jgi:hypothetical protein